MRFFVSNVVLSAVDPAPLFVKVEMHLSFPDNSGLLASQVKK